jgi:hypothetical protein
MSRRQPDVAHLQVDGCITVESCAVLVTTRSHVVSGPVPPSRLTTEQPAPGLIRTG